MSTSTAAVTFSGPYAEALTKFAELLEWLWSEHGTSFVNAGDDKVYAFGGNGYVVVFDDTKWDGVIELITPKGAASIKRDQGGSIAITSSVQDEASVREIILNGLAGLREYYEERYWSTPEASPEAAGDRSEA